MAIISRRVLGLALLFLFPLALVVINMRAVLSVPRAAIGLVVATHDDTIAAQHTPSPNLRSVVADKEQQQEGVWKLAQDPKTGNSYYYHTVTKATQWTPPADFQRSSDLDGVSPTRPSNAANWGVPVVATPSPRTVKKPAAPKDGELRGHDALVVHDSRHDVGIVGDASFEPRPGEHRVKALRVCTKVDSYVRNNGVIEKHNRTLCVAPVVQLATKLKVRLVPKSENGGKRAFFLISEGLRAHPMVELVGSPSRFCADKAYTLDPNSPCEKNLAKMGEQVEADVAIIIMPATDPKEFKSPNGILAFSPYRWGVNNKFAMDPIRNVGKVAGYENIKSADENPTLFRYQPPVDRSNVIIVDESDWAASHKHVKDDPLAYLAYFKRSWVMKNRDGFPFKAADERHQKSGGYFPMPYALADQYVDSRKLGDVGQDRPIKVVCTLRDTRSGRGRTLKWLGEYVKSQGWGPDKARVGELSSAGRTVIDTGYLTTMRRAQIVVTANPTSWEGDFRLFEAMSSGALVMVDRMATPYHHPLVDGVHLIYYDHRNRTDLIEKVKHALARPRWARAIAIRGYAHVLRHHRAVSWVDYFLRSAHSRLLDRQKMSTAHYAETGTEVLSRTKNGISHGADNGQPYLTEDQLTDDDAHDPVAVFAAHRRTPD